jgi:hypothetical protein
MKLPRWLNPNTNPAGWSAILGLAYATWQAVTAAQATGPLTWKQAGYIAAGVLWAAVSAYVRSHVTPVADPRDGNGVPLKSSNGWAAENLARAMERAAGKPASMLQPVTFADDEPPPVPPTRTGGHPPSVQKLQAPPVPPTLPSAKEQP